jgi:hypothetical protein
MASVINSWRRTILVLVCLSSSAIASITGWAQGNDQSLIVPQIVRQPSTLDSRLTQHYHLFVSILEASGFKVGQSDNPRALVLEVGFDRNPSTETVVAILWHRNTKLIDVRAEPGGTEGQRSYLVEPMVQRAAQRFESQLQHIRDSIVISANEDRVE